MSLALVTLLLQTGRMPTFFFPVAMLLLTAGLLGWLVATVLGFARAKAFGPAIRWFALASLFMLIHELQFVLLAVGIISQDQDLTLQLGAFFNLFAVVAAFCAVMGFVRLTSTR
jgi:hypothetical protein